MGTGFTEKEGGFIFLAGCGRAKCYQCDTRKLTLNLIRTRPKMEFEAIRVVHLVVGSGRPVDSHSLMIGKKVTVSVLAKFGC